MPNEINQGQDAQNEARMREDEALPAASEDKVLDQTVRLAREGRQQLESDPKEPKPASE
jgi:hypothetical protein